MGFYVLVTMIGFALLGCYFLKGNHFKMHKKLSKSITAMVILLLVVFSGTGCGNIQVFNQGEGASPQNDSKQGEHILDNSGKELKVHFIDVGQADSILIQLGDTAMLVDGGNNEDGTIVKQYLKKNNVTKLDYVVGTHAHEDHIGGLDEVIKSFEVSKVYFPKQTANTVTFKDFVNAVKNKGLSFTEPKVGDKFKLGDAECTIIAPKSKTYEDANDYSVVLKITYGNTSFLLTGDAEAKSEKEIVSGGMDISAQVLKVGHHGSSTSTSQAFLDKINPKYAVISVGEDNNYGHPAQSTLKKLSNKGIKVYRTDESGNIIAISDGVNISFKTETTFTPK